MIFDLPEPVCRGVLRPNFLSTLSQSFNDASHGSDLETAIQRGMLLFALYLTLYPPLFPQTGSFRLSSILPFIFKLTLDLRDALPRNGENCLECLH